MLATGPIGFIGTGAITEAMVRGLLAPMPVVETVIVSPRNAAIAARLAADFPGVRIAGDNPEIVEACQTLVLAVRPQIAEEVIRPLQFRDGQRVISVIAATDRDRLLSWIGADVRLTQAIPLPFVARRAGVTAIYPPDALTAALFTAMGTTVECETRQEYDLLAAASAVMASYFGIMHRTNEWLADHGLAEQKGRAYVAPLFAELSRSAVAAVDTPFIDLSREYATKGGLNEQVFNDFETHGGTAALRTALDRVLARITG